MSRTSPDNPRIGKNICLPILSNLEIIPLDNNLNNENLYVCHQAIGVEYTNERTANYTLINLGDGTNSVLGSIDSPNVFLIGQNFKHFKGGRMNDIFIFEERKTNLFNDIIGGLNGGYGTNTIDISRLTSNNRENKEDYRIVANFKGGFLSDFL